MKSNERISQILVDTKAYRDLDDPVILTSGQLGIYFINTEKILQDNGGWEKFGENSAELIKHSIQIMEKNPNFKEAINIMAHEMVSYVTDEVMEDENYAIAGGQRRDWIFSGPIAHILKAPHISLYKQTEGKPDRIEVIDFKGNKINDFNIGGLYSILFSDLITEGSSQYKKVNGVEKGWIPMLRERGSIVEHVGVVVTRLQGGEENLKKLGIETHSFVAIDEDFLRTYSTNPERALAYQSNPTAWSEMYLRENGALSLVKAFDPNAKDRRDKLFLSRYGEILKEAGKFGELEDAVKQNYNIEIGGI